MVTVETISIVFTGLSVSLAAFYYISTLRNAQRNRQLQLETRQLDLYMKWQMELTKPDVMKNLNDVFALEWQDFNDFRRKYDHTINPEDSSKRLSTWYYFNSLGYLLSRGMIDSDSVHEMVGVQMLGHWIKFEPIIQGYRKLHGRPELWMWFEHLADEMKKVRERKGFTEYVLPEPPK